MDKWELWRDEFILADHLPHHWQKQSKLALLIMIYNRIHKAPQGQACHRNRFERPISNEME
jgi:hypothetical protein